MNEILNSIFDDDSLSAIKNVQNQSKTSTEEHIEQKKEHEVTAMDQELKNSQLQDVETKLQNKIHEQASRISTIIASHNQLIKEFNQLAEKVNRIEARMIHSESVTSTPAQKSEEKPKPDQQTSAGEGLNPDDFSVEKHFYYGNK